MQTALSAAFLVVPLKTVLFEELAFRGLMPALLKELGSQTWAIAVISTVLFGIWHLLTVPAAGTGLLGGQAHLLTLAVTFLVTAAAGLMLYFLRSSSGSLVASVLVHWLINGSAIILAALSWHR